MVPVCCRPGTVPQGPPQTLCPLEAHQSDRCQGTSCWHWGAWGSSSWQVLEHNQGLLGNGCVTLQEPGVRKDPHRILSHRAPSQYQRFIHN